MAPPTDRLFQLASDVLAAIVLRWPSDATPLPEIQFVSNGTFAWDGCELLVVSILRTAEAQEGDPAIETIQSTGAFLGLGFAVVDITIARCVPDMVQTGEELPTVPTPEEYTAAAEIQLTDAQAMTNALLAAHRHGDLAGCGGMALEGWTSLGPEGGMGGGSRRARLSLI